MKNYDVIIIGAGPAGVFCAISIKEKNPSLNIAIIEKSMPLRKLVLSGGGRCNFSNKKAIPEICQNYYPRGSRFISKLLYNFNFNNFCDWLKNNDIDIIEEEENKLFLKSGDSNHLVNLFLRKLKEYSVELIYAEFLDFTKDTKFKITIKQGEKKEDYIASYLVISTGSNEDILKILKEKNIETTSFLPSLFGFYSKKIAKSDLSGISVKNVGLSLTFNEKNEITIKNEIKIEDEKDFKINKKEEIIKGGLLFTHEGLSGPSILKLSSFYSLILNKVNYKATLHIDFFPEINFDEFKKKLSSYFHSGSKLIKNIYSEIGLPANLWEYLLKDIGISIDKKATTITKEETIKIAGQCKDFILSIDGKAKNKEEFVSSGGVELKEIDRECKSKKIDRLYFIGEILNIDGITGGYNLQAAWTTAYCCADSIVKSSIVKSSFQN